MCWNAKRWGEGQGETEEGDETKLYWVLWAMLVAQPLPWCERNHAGLLSKDQGVYLRFYRGRIGAGLKTGDQDETKQLMESTYYSTWQTEAHDFSFLFLCSYINVV